MNRRSPPLAVPRRAPRCVLGSVRVIAVLTRHQAAPNAAAFKAKALPIHVNLTHTPPTLAEDTTDVAQTDPGFIGQTTLTPTTFNTGSYGWKGNKRVTIELENNETGEKEKVQVMMT